VGALGAGEGGQGVTPWHAEPRQVHDTPQGCCEVAVMAMKERRRSPTRSRAPSGARLTRGAGEASPTHMAGSPRDVRTMLFENASLAFQQGTHIGDVKCTNTVKHRVFFGSKRMGDPKASVRADLRPNKINVVKLLGVINVLIPDLNINIMKEHKSRIPESTGSFSPAPCPQKGARDVLQVFYLSSPLLTF